MNRYNQPHRKRLRRLTALTQKLNIAKAMEVIINGAQGNTVIKAAMLKKLPIVKKEIEVLQERTKQTI